MHSDTGNSSANGMNKQYPSTFQITPNWKLSLFAVLFLPLFITLGFWQLDRAKDKQQLIDAFTAQQLLPPISLNTYLADSAAQSFRQVMLTGQFDQQRFWLLDNQVNQGRVGYRLLLPLYVDHGENITTERQTVLIDWQWLPAPPHREDLPVVTIPQGQITITGYLAAPSDNPLLSFVSESDTWPQRIAEVDLLAMSEQLGVNLVSGVLKRQEYQAPINTTPAKHRGYAWQWFAMALALAVASLVANTNLVSLLSKTTDRSSTNCESL